MWAPAVRRGRLPSLAITTFVLVGLAALVAVTFGCNSLGLDVDVEADKVEGDWLATVREAADSCDDVSSPDLRGQIEIWREGASTMLEFADLDAGACWVWPMTRSGDRLTWSHGYEKEHPCRAGCWVEVESTLTLDFLPDGTFVGTEFVRFTPRTPECDDPACGFPCPSCFDHPFFPPCHRECALTCETRYTWDGTSESGLPAPPCG